MQRLWRREWLDVVLDIDDTLFYYPGSIDLKLYGSYRLAHGCLELIVALDKIPLVRTSLYIAGCEVRNKLLHKWITAEIKNMGYYLRKELRVFTVPDGRYGKKVLRGLRSCLDVDRAILVDDLGKFSEANEKMNLLKVYNVVEDCNDKVYEARLKNNLVRALGLILQSIQVSKKRGCKVVEALHFLQWEGTTYLHKSSNAEEIYELGLEALRDIHPGFTLLNVENNVEPWSESDNDALFHNHVY